MIGADMDMFRPDRTPHHGRALVPASLALARYVAAGSAGHDHTVGRATSAVCVNAREQIPRTFPQGANS